MEKKEYSVSEAVRLIGVESHVLRYWEEELQVEIRRTSQGHRIYSQENIETFCMVRELKEYGLQLKAIRYLLDKTGGGKAKTELTEQIFEIGNGAAGKKEGPPRGNTQEKAEKNGNRPPADKEAGPSEMSGEQIRTDSRKTNFAGTEEEQDQTDREEDPGQEEEQDPEEESPDMEGEAEPVYDLVVTPLPEDDVDKFSQFEEILKRIIGDIIEEKNQKMELSLRRMFREELDQFFLLYQDIAAEAAAEREEERARRGLFGFLRDLLRR